MLSARSRIVNATPGSMFVATPAYTLINVSIIMITLVNTPAVARPALYDRYIVATEEATYGIPPRRPNTTFGIGTEYATALVIPSCQH